VSKIKEKVSWLTLSVKILKFLYSDNIKSKNKKTVHQNKSKRYVNNNNNELVINSTSTQLRFGFGFDNTFPNFITLILSPL